MSSYRETQKSKQLNKHVSLQNQITEHIFANRSLGQDNTNVTKRLFFLLFFVGSWNVSVTMTRQNRCTTSQLGSKHASINGPITIQIEQHQISSDATAKILTIIFPLLFTQKKRYNKFQYTWQLNELWSAYFNTQPTPCYQLTRWRTSNMKSKHHICITSKLHLESLCMYLNRLVWSQTFFKAQALMSYTSSQLVTCIFMQEKCRGMELSKQTACTGV